MSVQTHRDEPSGLSVSDRFFQPVGAPKRHPLLWAAVDILLLLCLAGGLSMLFTSGFSVGVSLWFYPGVFLLCVGITLLFRSEWFARHRLVLWISVLLMYLLALFLCQDAFLRGMGQFGNRMVDTLNQTYNGEPEAAPAAAGADAAEIFLLLAAIPVMVWLAVSLFQKNSLLMAGLLLFPLLALLVLCGAARNTAALCLVMLGIVLSMAFSMPKRQHRMWGGGNPQLQKENRLRFQSIQKKITVFMLAAFLVLSIPGFFLIRPLLSVSLKPAEQISMEIQSDILTKVMKLLPELSAGAWNLSVEAVGGGVQDGAVDSREGYLLEGVEDLRLTLDRKPQETLFLKGYVGTSYQDGGWENPYGSTFDGAAINWNTEGSARLYIQNLPFLRTAYALAQKDSGDPDTASAMSGVSVEPAQLRVERVNANDSYTYVPYGTYLNDYYQVNAGDGAVAGQLEQEDRFFFFFREDMEAVLLAWNDLEATANVLDRVEESYRAFCETNHQTASTGMDTLQETVDAVIGQNRWNADENIDEITAWIRQYLAENYQYQLNPEAVPDGKDPLAYFLLESKTGNSVHFASAAVVLYRMFGIPARYVVGYEVPPSLFSAQSNGTYTATVQGDNSQAWAEIYVPGVGWLPKDMTPGVIGTYEEVGPGGERIEAPVESSGGTETEGTLPTEETEDTAPAVSAPESGVRLRLKDYSVEQIITGLLWILLPILLVVGLGISGSHICRGLGFDPFHRRSRRQRLLGVFQALFARTRRLGLPQEVNSQSEEFFSFCETELSRRRPEAAGLLRPAVEKLYKSCFGGERVTERDIRAMRSLLLAFYKKARA